MPKGEAGTSASAFAESSVWDILDQSDKHKQDDEVVEEADVSVLDLADAAGRASTLSQLHAQEQSTGDISAVALGNPETLANYLTGNHREGRTLYFVHIIGNFYC